MKRFRKIMRWLIPVLGLAGYLGFLRLVSETQGDGWNGALFLFSLSVVAFVAIMIIVAIMEFVTWVYKKGSDE